MITVDGNKTKAREIYVVTHIVDNMCTLRKFTKTPFRSKTYEVKMTNCFPVCNSDEAPNTPVRELQYGLENDDSLDTNSNTLSHVFDNLLPVTPPEIINRPSILPP